MTYRRMTHGDVGTFKNDDPEVVKGVQQAIDQYLKDFAFNTEQEGHCIQCGGRLGGILGTFEWGITHGEGRCGPCGWPARGYHRVEVPGNTLTIRLIYQYHPDVVESDPPGRNPLDMDHGEPTP